MAEKNDTTKHECCNSRNWKGNGNAAGGGAVYGMGLIGALVYFIGIANGFWDGVLGILKALVWPAMLIYHLLGFLKV